MIKATASFGGLGTSNNRPLSFKDFPIPLGHSPANASVKSTSLMLVVYGNGCSVGLDSLIYLAVHCA